MELENIVKCTQFRQLSVRFSKLLSYAYPGLSYVFSVKKITFKCHFLYNLKGCQSIKELKQNSNNHSENLTCTSQMHTSHETEHYDQIHHNVPNNMALYDNMM